MSAAGVPASSERDALALELEALETIARVIDSLPAAARARVLRWACERCNMTEVLMPGGATAPISAEPIDPRFDPALAVDALDDLFGPSIAQEREWRREQPSVTAALDLDDAIAETPGQTLELAHASQTPQPAKALLDGFVRDFRQLVVEWEGAA